MAQRDIDPSGPQGLFDAARAVPPRRDPQRLVAPQIPASQAWIAIAAAIGVLAFFSLTEAVAYHAKPEVYLGIATALAVLGFGGWLASQYAREKTADERSAQLARYRRHRWRRRRLNAIAAGFVLPTYGAVSGLEALGVAATPAFGIAIAFDLVLVAIFVVWRGRRTA